jgi:hypothetical protein
MKRRNFYAGGRYRMTLAAHARTPRRNHLLGAGWMELETELNHLAAPRIPDGPPEKIAM